MNESTGMRTRIVRYDPRDRLLRRLGAVAVLALLLGGALGIGYWRGQAAAGLLLDEAAIFRAQLAATEAEFAATRATLVGLQAGAEIDRDSLAQVRATVASERERVARLEHEITVFKSLMDSSVKTVGLAVYGFEAIPGAREDSFHYRLTLLQRSDELRNIKGEVEVALVDALGVSHPLTRLDRARSNTTMTFKFRYFEVFEGEMDLPEGFEPVKVHVVASSTGRERYRIDRELEWQPLEEK